MVKIRNNYYEVIDAHTHISEYISGFGYRGELRPLGNGKARWATGEEIDLLAEGYGSKSFSYKRLLEELDIHGISRAILLQGSFLGFCNDYIHEAQEEYPDRFFGMGTFDPYCLEFPQIMKRLIKDFKFRGFKFEISSSYGLMGYHPELKIDGEIMHPVLNFAQNEQLIISFDLGMFHEPSFQINRLAYIAKLYPGINFVVEHLLYLQPDHCDEVKKMLEIVSNCSNIYFTTASIPNNTLHEMYPFPLACRYLEIAKEIVGSDKLMWGSDIPTAIVKTAYSDLINYIAESGIFNNEELEKIYSKNAVRIYRL